MTLRQLIHKCKNEEYQLLHECLISARAVKARKGNPAHCRVEFATQRFTPNAALNPARGTHVGVIIWVPISEYNELTRKEQG